MASHALFRYAFHNASLLQQGTQRAISMLAASQNDISIPKIISDFILSSRAFSASSSCQQRQDGPNSQQPVDLQELRDVPGYLKGPIGRRVVKVYGEDEWVSATDPKTGETCWKNIKTGEMTAPGMEKPDTWTEVADKETGLLYYWNKRTGEATEIGEPKPGAFGRSRTTFNTPDPEPSTTFFGSSKPDPLEARGKQDKADFNLWEFINRPTGWAFLFFSFLAVAVPYAWDALS